MTRTIIFSIAFAAAALASVPIRDGCSEDDAVVATVQETDPVQVRHAVVGEAHPCYSVVATQNGQQVQGFILGATLPVIQEFERTRALESRIYIPVVAPVEGEKKGPMPPVGPRFEFWSGVDVKGKRIQVDASNSKATLVTFWTAQSGTARRYVENLKKFEAEFRPKGLRSFGLIESSSVEKTNYYLEDMGLDCPQAYDRQGLGAKYNADPARGTTLVVDSSNNVVAISSNAAEIRAAVARLLSLE